MVLTFESMVVLRFDDPSLFDPQLSVSDLVNGIELMRPLWSLLSLAWANTSGWKGQPIQPYS